MSNFFNSPLLDLIQSKSKTPEQQVQRATSPIQSFVNFISSDKGKAIQTVDGHYDYHPDTKSWSFMRSEKPLESVEQKVAEILPGTGDVAEIAQIGRDISSGQLGSALLGAGFLILPGNLNKTIKNSKPSQYLNGLGDEWDPWHSVPIRMSKVKNVPSLKEIFRKIDNTDIQKEIPIKIPNERGGVDIITEPNRIFPVEIGNKDFNLQSILENTNFRYNIDTNRLTESAVDEITKDLKHFPIFTANFTNDVVNPALGWYVPKTNKTPERVFISNQNKKLLPTAMHEIGGHWYSYRIPEPDLDLLNRSLQVLDESVDPTSLMARNLGEKFSELMRYRLPLVYDIKNQLGKWPTRTQMQDFIYKIPNDELISSKYIGRYLNGGYGKSYKKYIDKYPESINNLKLGLMHIWKQGGKIDENN